MNLTEYYEQYGNRIKQSSEKLFVEEFLYPLLGTKIEHVEPQYPFIDSTGKCRYIDFAYHGSDFRIALEVNGETYHSEGIIPNEMFDDNLFRQNEILRLGYKLVRFSYNQLQSSQWRSIVQETLRDTFGSYAPELLSNYALKPLPLQNEVLETLKFYREVRNWKKGIIVLPTGTGKTILSALDAKRQGGRVLFLVHRLDILKQSIDAYKLVWPDMTYGILTGEARENIYDCNVLFASKDTLRQTHELKLFDPQWFNYIVIDEVHHGQSPTYREILLYFEPAFMLGMTATPDRADRHDIFELFDYNKIFELSLQEAIEHGYLVPYTYYGLKDNVDYSNIRYENQRYRVDDLERNLLIPERNEAIVAQYLEKGHGDKAIGFCVSIKHAERMAELFQSHNISAAAIHSQSSNRDNLISEFKNNKIQVVFTVDLFNEGIDFPNVRVLLFLRPTESKTVFIQQLGRGLRSWLGKDRVRILDFIGNYKRANQIRKHLSKSSYIKYLEQNGRQRQKTEYTYSTNCEVIFDSDVENMLDRQDAEELGLTKEDLKEAYYLLAEALQRKPSRADLDEQGEYKSSHYFRLFGSWTAFLREVGEYTEASYHYPQGVHLGHILSILKVFGSGRQEETHFRSEYIRFRGNLGTGRIASYRRQIKYKLQAAMELGILTDDRNYPQDTDYPIELTPVGEELYQTLKPLLDELDLSFSIAEDGIPSTRMQLDEQQYNLAIRQFISLEASAAKIVYNTFLRMHAIQQMLAFLYHICRTSKVSRKEIYEQFFQAPFVKHFCDQEGIEEATLEASKHRCPFLLNILDASGIIDIGKETITIQKLVLLPSLVRPHTREEKEKSLARLKVISESWPTSEDKLLSEDLSIVRELFGPSFLTSEYYIQTLLVIDKE
jgi:superfamily II DNA or RNA helicase